MGNRTLQWSTYSEYCTSRRYQHEEYMDAIYDVQLPRFRIARRTDGLGKEERGSLGIKSLVVHGNSALSEQKKGLATAATYCGKRIISTGPSKPNTRMGIKVKGSE